MLDVLFVGRLRPEAVGRGRADRVVPGDRVRRWIGLSMSVTALVARRIGEKDEEQAALTAVQAIALGVAGSVPFALAAFWTRELLGLMGAPSSVVEIGWATPPGCWAATPRSCCCS